MSCPFFSCFLLEWSILGCGNHDITVACASKVLFKESAQKFSFKFPGATEFRRLYKMPCLQDMTKAQVKFI